MIDRKTTPRRTRLRGTAFTTFILGTLALVGLQCSAETNRTPTVQTMSLATPVTASATSVVRPEVAADMLAAHPEEFAKRDPLGFLQACWAKYRKNVSGYHCTFTKQEFLNGELREPQTAEVKVRQAPFSVDMTFTENVGACARALYVAGQWQDDSGNNLAWVKPAGAILSALVPKIKQPIHGARARKESRRTIDQFGFDNSFELIIRYSLAAQAEGKLDLDYLGPSQFNGRPTYVFHRRLPYTGQELPYPDALLEVHIDQESLTPISCASYADDAGTKLLGSYVYTDIDWNPGYTADDFDPEKIGF